MKVYDKRNVSVGPTRTTTEANYADKPVPQPIAVTDFSIMAERLGILVGSLHLTSSVIGDALKRFDNSDPPVPEQCASDERPDNALGRVHTLLDRASYLSDLLRAQSDRISNIA